MPTAARNDDERWERFWSKVDQSGDCWEWNGARTPAGYGSVKVAQRVYYAHRLVVQANLNRPLATHEVVCHRCDNPSCVRPSHLMLGTSAMNAQDCAAKLRGNGRPNSTVAKLTDEQVLRVRRDYATGEHTQQSLASQLGVSQMTISNIVTGKTWRRLL